MKRGTLALLDMYVLATAVWHGGTPEAEVMGVVGITALIANVAVVVAAAGVFRTGTA